MSCHLPLLMPVAFVSRLKCHSLPTRRNWLPVVAAPVGVASIAGSESVWLLHLMACRVWTPVSTGEPPQDAENFTGIVLFNLNVRNGSAKLPPAASAPPMGERNPVKLNDARVTVNVQLEAFPLASVAVEAMVVVPIGKPEPDAGVEVTAGEGLQLSLAVTENVTGTSRSMLQGMAMFAGQVIVGFSASFTVTVKVQSAWLPDASVAVQVTVVVPFGKVEPDGGLQLTVAPAQLSEAVGAG